MLELIAEFVRDLDLLGVEKAKRIREHDEGVFMAFSELSPKKSIQEICEEVTGDATYYSSQIYALEEISKFISDENNTFCVIEIEDAFCGLCQSIDALVDFLPAVSLPNCYQNDDSDTVYTFNYKRWGMEPGDYEKASLEFQENMRQAISLCGDINDDFATFREHIRKLLQK